MRHANVRNADEVEVREMINGGHVADDSKIYRQLHRYLTDFLTAITRLWPNIPFNLNDPPSCIMPLSSRMSNIFGLVSK